MRVYLFDSFDAARLAAESLGVDWPEFRIGPVLRAGPHRVLRLDLGTSFRAVHVKSADPLAVIADGAERDIEGYGVLRLNIAEKLGTLHHVALNENTGWFHPTSKLGRRVVDLLAKGFRVDSKDRVYMPGDKPLRETKDVAVLLRKLRRIKATWATLDSLG